VKSLELYIKLYKESPPECINYIWFDAGLQFGMKGNVGIMFWWSPYFYLVTKAGYEVKEDSILGIDGKPNYDKYRCALLPRNPAYPQVHSVSAWTFGIPTYSANKEEAWEFIKWATSAKTQKEMGLSLEPSPYQFSDFARKSLYEDKQLQEIYPWLPLQLKLFEGWESPYKCIPSGKIVRPGMPLYVTLEGVYGLYLNKALAGEMSPSEALDTANSFMKTLLERNFYIPWKGESYNDTLENCIELMKRLS
jgi:multiple sugar transport system substrate-binding protein